MSTFDPELDAPAETDFRAAPAAGLAASTARVAPRPARPSGDPADVVLERTRQRLAATPKPESAALAAKILKGESFAEIGERDTVLHRAASIVAFIEPDEDPTVLAELFAESLSQWEADDAGQYTQADRLKWAADKIRRAQERRRCEPDDDRQRPYTLAEVGAFAASQKTTVGHFQRQWLVQKDRTYYVFRRSSAAPSGGAYAAPVTHAELETCFYRDLEPAADVIGGVKLWGQDAKGASKPVTLATILKNHGSVARQFESSLVAQESIYSQVTETFVEAVCPRRPIRPTHHSDVDAWLRLLAGDRADKLLDWVASVTRLDRQSAALFMVGEPGTGKTMLATGLAKLWTTGGPTSLEAVAGDWTEDIARCPLIFADEQLPRTISGTTPSTYLRELIGSSKRPLKRKFRSNTDLHGAIRLVLASNNVNMLGFEESFSSADLAAVAERFLVVHTHAPARDYLRSISTEGWVDGDVIAEHALWLAANRQVTPGQRYIVEGTTDELSATLATQTPVAGLVAEWLANALADAGQPTAKAGPTQRGQILIGNGVFDVAVSALVDFWDLHVKEQRQPRTKDIAAALKNLSVAYVRRGGRGTYARRRYWRINTDLITRFADELGTGLPEDLKATVDRVMEDHPGLGNAEDDEGEET